MDPADYNLLLGFQSMEKVLRAMGVREEERKHTGLCSVEFGEPEGIVVFLLLQQHHYRRALIKYFHVAKWKDS